jgi:hypothetical protein
MSLKKISLENKQQDNISRMSQSNASIITISNEEEKTPKMHVSESQDKSGSQFADKNKANTDYTVDQDKVKKWYLLLFTFVSQNL